MAMSHGAVAGANSPKKRKRTAAQIKRGGSKRSAMDREMNTPRPGPWANRVWVGGGHPGGYSS